MWPSISRLKYFAKTSVTATSLCIGIYFLIFFFIVKICLFSKTYSNCRNNLMSVISEKSEKSDPVIKFYQIFTNRDIVNCLDTLLTKHKNKKLHIAFIGDSLVRNQFVNFLKVSYIFLYLLYLLLVGCFKDAVYVLLFTKSKLTHFQKKEEFSLTYYM